MEFVCLTICIVRLATVGIPKKIFRGRIIFKRLLLPVSQHLHSQIFCSQRFSKLTFVSEWSRKHLESQGRHRKYHWKDHDKFNILVSETLSRGLMHVERTIKDISSKFCERLFMSHVIWDINYSVCYLETALNGSSCRGKNNISCLNLYQLFNLWFKISVLCLSFKSFVISIDFYLQWMNMKMNNKGYQIADNIFWKCAYAKEVRNTELHNQLKTYELYTKNAISILVLELS
jgi:hypothetical protein